MSDERETRLCPLELRSDPDSPTLRGYAATFNNLSENLGGFREKIEPGAFDNVLSDDVRALINHDSNLILGRTKADTLFLSVDDTGLRYEINPPQTRYAADLLLSVKRGDVSQSSFAFSIDRDSWDEDDDGRIIRTIHAVKRLYDVSPVTFPAYPDTAVAVRSLQQQTSDKKRLVNERRDRIARKTWLYQNHAIFHGAKAHLLQP